MSIAMMLALLVQAGACAPAPFHGSDGSTLTVVVCPQMKPAVPAPSETAPDQPAAPTPDDRAL